VEKLGEDGEAAVIRGLQDATLRLQAFVPEAIAETTPYPPQDTGELTRSAHSELSDRGGFVIVDAPHASHMEYGTRPHFPPLQPIKDWVLRKGIADTEEEADQAALNVARKIAARGLAPRFYMRRAVEKLIKGKYLQRSVGRELKAIEGA
jgi:hypothetical protein